MPDINAGESGDTFDTIVAAATPPGRSAIAMIRVDGPLVPNILLKLAGKCPEPRLATHVTLRDASGAALEDGVIVRFQAPRSFTGNDTAEITIHGNPRLVDRMIREVTRLGARVAEAGEFTERAVLNGKLDLLQAEAIAELIESRTASGAALALSQLGGSFSRASYEIHAELLEIMTLVEGALDFADEGYEFISRARLTERLALLGSRLRQLLGTFKRGRAVTEGIRIVLLGQPNSGKSTLMNRLVGTDRAIVTDQPGTTRDLLRETIELAGVAVTVIDTAGLRETMDAVEGIGVSRAREAAGSAELVLYLVDASIGLNEADRQELAQHPDAIQLFTKIDLSRAPTGALGISAETSEGFDEMLESLNSRIQRDFDLTGEGPAITNLRQFLALEAGLLAIEGAIESATAGSSEEYIAADLYRAASSIGSLTGAISAADARREIFSRFCIGK